MIKELFFQIILCWLEVEQNFLENPCFNFKQVFQSTSCYTQKPLFILHTSLKNIYFCTTICYNTRNLADKNLLHIFGDFATFFNSLNNKNLSKTVLEYKWISFSNRKIWVFSLSNTSFCLSLKTSVVQEKLKCSFWQFCPLTAYILVTW